MPKATIIVQVDFLEEVDVLERWLETWTPHLADLSENLGCGCCVDMFEVEAPQNALDELPDRLLSSREWTNPEWLA